MALYVIGDLHLSLSTDKPMTVFGEDWLDHVNRLKEGFRCVCPEDTVVLLGDLSWGLNFSEAAADFLFMDALPGHKIIVKGNHDYWWSTVTRMERNLEGVNISDMKFLHNTAFFMEDAALCGTRGWFYEEEKASHQDSKVFVRELGRLRTSFEMAKTQNPREIICFLHYPPLYEGYRCDEIVDMMNEYGVKRCYYGHLHGYGRDRAIEGDYKGICYHLVSADHLKFKPVLVTFS